MPWVKLGLLGPVRSPTVSRMRMFSEPLSPRLLRDIPGASMSPGQFHLIEGRTVTDDWLVLPESYYMTYRP